MGWDLRKVARKEAGSEDSRNASAKRQATPVGLPSWWRYRWCSATPGKPVKEKTARVAKILEWMLP
jgi:hypothetical protein